MDQNRLAKAVETLNGTGKPAATVTAPTRKKASSELVLAAHLNQSREQIIALRKQVAEQEQIISQLQNQIAFLDIQSINKENEKLREEYGLKLGQQLVQDGGEWWLVEGQSPTSN